MRLFLFFPIFSFLFFTFPLKISGSERVLFLGISGDEAPSVEETLDRLIRERLSVIPDIAAIDYIETLRFRKQIGLDSYHSASENNLKNIGTILQDSLIIVWGRVKKISVDPVRSKLIKLYMEAGLTLGLSVYLPMDRRFAYTGNIESRIRKRKGFIFFSSVKETPPLGASERNQLIDMLLDDAAAKSVAVVSSLIRSERMRAASVNKPDSTDKRAPSISDVFTVPSVTPPVIEDKSRPNTDSLRSGISTVSDTVKNKSPTPTK